MIDVTTGKLYEGNPSLYCKSLGCCVSVFDSNLKEIKYLFCVCPIVNLTICHFNRYHKFKLH